MAKYGDAPPFFILFLKASLILKSLEPFTEMTHNNPKFIRNGYLVIALYLSVKIEATKPTPNQTNGGWMGQTCPLTPELKFGPWHIHAAPKLILNGYLAIAYRVSHKKLHLVCYGPLIKV